MTQPVVAMVLFGLEGAAWLRSAAQGSWARTHLGFCHVFHIVDFQNDPQPKSGNLPGKSLLKVHKTAIHGSLNTGIGPVAAHG